ncbi:maestro heat-like repeat-containing protein family member 7 [Glossophaga mutica]
MKLLLTAACGGWMPYTEKQECWEHLCNPELYYLGVMELTSVIVKNCELAILQQILNHIKNLLCSLDNHEKILARSIYAELLRHRSVAETLEQDIVGNLSSWIMEPDLIIKEIGLRGISNLALHPGKSESLKTLVPFLKDLLKDSKWRVRVQAVKALQDITHHGKREDIKMVFGSIAEQLRALLNDEKDEVRISTTSALGHMLCQVKKFKPGSTLRKEINSFLVPLLLSIQDSNADVVKACGRALTEWTKVTGWLRLIYVFQESNLSDPIHVLEETSNYLVSTRDTQFLGDLLLQSFEFLRSSQPFLRTAAVIFVASITLKINLKYIREDDVQLLQNKPVQQWRTGAPALARPVPHTGSLENEPCELGQIALSLCLSFFSCIMRMLVLILDIVVKIGNKARKH